MPSELQTEAHRDDLSLVNLRAAFALSSVFVWLLFSAGFGIRSRVVSSERRLRPSRGCLTIVFKPESYVFGKGGYRSGPLNDSTIDKLDFLSIAHTIAGPLADQHYYPGRDPSATQLLIMVYWGTTNAPEHASDSPEFLAAQRYFEAAALMPENFRSPVPITRPSRCALKPKISNSWRTDHARGTWLMRDNENKRNAMLLGYNSVKCAMNDAPMGTPKELRGRT